MAKIKNPLTINGLTIKNRIAMAPMSIPKLDGNFGKVHVDHYSQRARGGAGLIILQSINVEGAINSNMKWTDENIKALAHVVNACHSHKAAIIAQLSCTDKDINQLSISEINSIQINMLEAAIVLSKVGFDGIEYLFAHGNVFSKFIDKFHNKRTDKYGGSFDKRVKVLTEIISDIRKTTNKKYIIGVRMGEYLPGSADGIQTAQAFEAAGIDFLDISYGTCVPIAPVPNNFNGSALAYSGAKIRKKVKIPVIGTGEIYNEELVRFLLENDFLDMVSIGRGMLADPDFANHVINSEFIHNDSLYECKRCTGNIKGCMWFTEPDNCPARKSRALYSNEKET